MNVETIKNCYGCGVCAVVCSKKIINITINSSGFYEPIISNLSQCTNCGLCLDVCAFSHNELSASLPVVKSYAAWSRDKRVQRKCSSGGVGFELGKYLLQQSYKVCAVRYDAEKGRAEHYVATSLEELVPSIGSKYIQSYTVDGFKGVNRKDKFLVTGTPCQIDSFRRYIQKFKCENNFVLMDFFCHSVPSMWAWRKYIELVERKTGKITYASWRNKFTGWHDSWAMSIDGEATGTKVDWHDSYNMLMEGKKGFYNSRLSEGDVFYKLFLGDFCCNPACQKDCKYKYQASAADIRIGDLWGKTYKDNEDGVSAVIAFTEKGNQVLRALDCVLIEHPFEVVAEGQMKKNVKKAYLSGVVHPLLRSKYCTVGLLKFFFLIEQFLHFPNKIWNKYEKVISRY